MNCAIVKFGGSLLGSPDLDAWLAAILSSNVPMVIVPGGGRFADAVREAQKTIGFDDEAAHRMALLAMDQVAVLLASRSAGFSLAASRAEITEVLSQGRIPVWLASAMVLAATEVPASWDVTSDSLAAWLAATLGAARLLLIKSRDAQEPVTLRGLADAGIVDPLFPVFVQRAAVEVSIAGPAALARAGDMLRAGGMPGGRVATEPIAPS